MKDACPIPNLPNFDSKTIKQELHKAVGHIYSRIMTNELALQYNLFGRNNNPNGPQKEGFKQFKELLTVTFGKLSLAQYTYMFLILSFHSISVQKQ